MAMERFGRIFEIRVPRTLIGLNAHESAGRVARELGARKVLIMTDPGILEAGLAARVAGSLEREGLPCTIYPQCLADSQFKAINESRGLVRDEGINLIIGLGGGAVMDTAKLAGLPYTGKGNLGDILKPSGNRESGVRRILIPTTSGTGSEWSNVAIFMNEAEGRRIPVYSDLLWADAAIIDPVLTLELPPALTADAGMDALSHAIEAYTSWKANVFTDAMAEKAIRLIAEDLRTAYANGPKHIEARYRLSVAAGLAGLAMRSSGSYIVHSFTYPLCSQAELSHGAACSLLLPPVMEFNLIGSLEKFAGVARLMGEKTEGLPLRDQAGKSVDAVRRLAADLNMKQALGEAGISEKDIPGIVDYIFRFHSYQIENNPRNLSREDARRILESVL